jgi:RTX calcium-binding nonapeptide repeat (4 copies)
MMIATKLRWNNVRQVLTTLTGTKRQTRKYRSRLTQLERLESRQLMAVLDTSTGNLTVEGTANSDNIMLTNVSGRIGVVRNGAADPISVPGFSSSTSIPISWVRSIVINGRLGNDRLDASAVSIPTTLNGHDGSDTLIGGTGNDLLNGAEGNDVMYGGAGNELMTGGAGSDRMWGNAGNDFIVGGTGNDFIYGEAGNDTLRGDANDDALFGGIGTDSFDGGAGDFDRTDAVFGESTLNLENPISGRPLVVNGARNTDIRQVDHPLCVFYSHLSGMAGILTARGRNLANERIDYKGLDSGGNANYAVRLYSSSGTPVTRTVTYNGVMAGDALPVEGEGWVTIIEKAFMDQLRAEDPTTSLWSRYWDHRTVMMILNGSSEAVHMIDHFSAGLGSTLADVHFGHIAAAIEAGKLVTASTWNSPFRGASTTLVITSHNYTVVGVNRTAGTITLRNPWGFDMDSRGTAVGDTTDGLVTLSWADFKGSFQGYNVGVVA